VESETSKVRRAKRECKFRAENWGSPLDRAALNQGRELERRKRVIKKIWVRLAAMNLCSSPKRFKQLFEESCQIAGKESKRLWELDHPRDREPRTPLGLSCGTCRQDWHCGRCACCMPEEELAKRVAKLKVREVTDDEE